MELVKNVECKGIELYFDVKPAQEVINILKEAKFRWHHFKKCWYAKDNEKNIKIAESIQNNKAVSVKDVELVNDLGIKVGDIFYTSWGYEQTNINLFQVVALKGKTQVIIKEVCLSEVDSSYHSSMSRDVIFNTSKTSLVKYPSFVDDQEKGLIKKVCGTKESPFLKLTSYAYAYPYKGEALYESWYY